jgi:hypothetical protein
VSKKNSAVIWVFLRSRSQASLVDSGLASADYDVTVSGFGDRGQIVERHEPHTIIDRETRRVGGRHTRLQIRSVDRLDPGGRVIPLPGDVRDEVSVTLVAVEWEVLDSAGREELMAHDVVEVGADGRSARQLAKPIVEATLFEEPAAQLGRTHAIERRRLMQPHEGVRHVPVSTGLLVTVDDDDRRVGLGEQHIGERHANRTTSGDDVVGLEFDDRFVHSDLSEGEAHRIGPSHARREPYWGMATRFKLSGAPLGYTLAQVDGTADHYKAFGTALWSDEQQVSAALKELIFLRTSIINECPT